MSMNTVVEAWSDIDITIVGRKNWEVVDGGRVYVFLMRGRFVAVFQYDERFGREFYTAVGTDGRQFYSNSALSRVDQAAQVGFALLELGHSYKHASSARRAIKSVVLPY